MTSCSEPTVKSLLGVPEEKRNECSEARGRVARDWPADPGACWISGPPMAPPGDVGLNAPKRELDWDGETKLRRPLEPAASRERKVLER